MRLDVAYGEETRSLLMPARASVTVLGPPDARPIDDPAAALAHVCAKPTDSEPLADRVKKGASVLIVVSDITRSKATKLMLPAMVVHLAALGVERGAVRVLVARGTHRSLTREEKRFFRGKELQGVNVEEHDCDDAAALKALMLTRRGTPVRIHRLVRESDLVVLLSPVSFHYFAGFGGGRKLIMPGCADRQSILANHRLSLVDAHPATLHPSCRPGNLDGNPVHDDMLEVARSLGHLFAVNFFTDVEENVVFVNAGDPVTSHMDACTAYAAACRVRLDARAPVVVASAGGWPHDINLLQAHKSLYHAAMAAAPGSSILLYARCAEGVGSESLARAIARPRKEFFDDAYDAYALNNQTAVSLLTLTRMHRVAMVTELGDDVLGAAGIEPCTNAEAWLAAALESTGSDRVCAIRHAGQVLPDVTKEK